MSHNPYQQGPSAEQGYGYGQEHELQNYGQQPAASQTLPQQEFLGRIDFLRNEIGTLASNVQAIASLHQRSLAEADGGMSNQQLERIVTETQSLNGGIRDQLKFLANDADQTVDGSRTVKKRQVDTIKAQFERELRSYQEEESSFRSRYRDQIARQYRIVNPEASEDEVREATEADWGNEGVFQTALRTNRTGQASSVLGAVRARHNELQRIEKTLMELASLFQDLAVLVEQQEAPVIQAEQNAENTKTYIDDGNQQVKKGIISARNARKWKWWCLLITILIIAVAVGVGVGVTQASKAASGN
ncbi:putative snare domain-containing protein [Rosellinia necatrix]|uniref:Putative snare domain-containing protein n=1 Tax=Rosellinia necatrix TaxID=77044 RepID=A0A1W2TRU8_ROSNE|nr:putative snare domain-containing protein [Rosellinia necatrix]